MVGEEIKRGIVVVSDDGLSDYVVEVKATNIVEERGVGRVMRKLPGGNSTNTCRRSR